MTKFPLARRRLATAVAVVALISQAAMVTAAEPGSLDGIIKPTPGRAPIDAID